jgi:hypothetical protein
MTDAVRGNITAKVGSCPLSVGAERHQSEPAIEINLGDDAPASRLTVTRIATPDFREVARFGGSSGAHHAYSSRSAGL